MFWTKFREGMKDKLGEDHILGKGKSVGTLGRTHGKDNPAMI